MNNYIIDRSEFDSSGNWSVSNAFHMMKLSYAVYAGTTDNIGSSEDWSITETLVNSAGYGVKKIETHEGIYEPNAMICWDEHNVFLIFRGTEPLSWNQWATDADLFKKPFCVGEIHGGFATSVESIWQQIMETLKEVYDAEHKLLFVGGHSLGAGMSQAATSKLEFEESINPAAIYNFGCPRAFNVDGADLYNQRLGSKTFRVVNNNDVVCNVPFENMGFSHVGQFKYLTSDGKLWDDPSYWRQFIDSVSGGARALTELNPVDSITDHLPQNYTACLKRLL